MAWRYRVVKDIENDEEIFSIREVYDKYGMSQNPIPAVGNTLEELRETLHHMLDALDDDVLEGEEFNTLEHTNVRLITHRKTQCQNHTCTIHHRSDHRMRSFPQQYRSDINLMERRCPHGIGHPDPDDINAEKLSVHGCDGCCAP